MVRVKSQNYFATDGQSVSQSILALSPSETHDQILVVVGQLRFCLSWGVLSHDGTNLSRNKTQSLSMLAKYTYVHFEFLFYKHFCFNFFVSFVLSCFPFFFFFFFFLGLQSRFCTGNYVYFSYTKVYNNNLDNRSIICLTVTKLYAFCGEPRLDQCCKY
jgi:hypothetical protein